MPGVNVHAPAGKHACAPAQMDKRGWVHVNNPVHTHGVVLPTDAGPEQSSSHVFDNVSGHPGWQKKKRFKKNCNSKLEDSLLRSGSYIQSQRSS